MAFLMLLCQKMKLQREENRLTLEQMRFSSKVDRMEKKVGKRQKYYDKLKKQLERQANCYKNSMNMQISNMFGIGANSVNLMNPYGGNGAAMQILSGLDWSKNPYTNEDTGLTEEFKKAYMSGKIATAWKDYAVGDDLGGGIKATQAIAKGALFNTETCESYSQQQAKAFELMQQAANAQVTQAQTMATQMKSAYENNVSIWLEAQQEQLEAQEEWEMDLLAEEQADMEADKNMVEAKLKRVQQEKQNIEQALGQAIQDSAPKFGLG